MADDNRIVFSALLALVLVTAVAALGYAARRRRERGLVPPF